MKALIVLLLVSGCVAEHTYMVPFSDIDTVTMTAERQGDDVRCKWTQRARFELIDMSSETPRFEKSWGGRISGVCDAPLEQLDDGRWLTACESHYIWLSEDLTEGQVITTDAQPGCGLEYEVVDIQLHFVNPDSL